MSDNRQFARIGEQFAQLQGRILARFPGRTWEDILSAGREPSEEEVRSRQLAGLRRHYEMLSGIENWSMTLTWYNPNTPSQRTARSAVVERIEGWPQGRESSLVLWGRHNGTGKTHLATAYAVALLARPKPVPVCWCRTADLVARLEAERFEEEPITFRQARSASLLVLDDIDKLNLSGSRGEWLRETIYRLLDARYLGNRATVITTQCSRDEVREMLGRAVIDRLPAHWWIEVAGPSGRMAEPEP